MADRKIFGQALQHLFPDAAQFTPDGGHICIAARVEQGSDAVIDIRDDGLGVDRTRVEIDRAFCQADPLLSRAFGGTGLGLFPVTKYLALHDGRLALESETGRALLARVYMPNSVAAAAAAVRLQAVA